jgi:hypothetical protein
MADHISPDSLESLKTALINAIADQVICITGDDFRRLTGDEIGAFCSEGRLMMGNLAAAANCTIDTSTGTAVFTKNPARPTAGVWTKFDGIGSRDDRSVLTKQSA